MENANSPNIFKKFSLIKIKLAKFINEKIDKKQKICLLVGIVFSILSILFNETIFTSKNEIRRNPYGMGNTEYTLKVKGLDKTSDDITFNVSSRRYTKETANLKFNEIFLKLADYILLKNSSFDEIRSNLKLNNYFSKEGIYVDYLFKLDDTYEDDLYEKYRNILQLDGRVNNEALSESEVVTGKLKVIFSCFINDSDIRYSSAPYIIPIKIKGKILSERERNKINLLELIKNIDRGTIENQTIKLPDTLAGTMLKISYLEKPNYTFLLLLFISILVAILLPLKDKSKKDEENKNRIRILTLEYYSFVTKLAIYISAGETVRNAFTRINRLYKTKVGESDNILNNELEITIRKMDNGVNEEIALSDLSNRIGLRQYTKLFNILEQNRKNGSSDVKIALYNELDDAFKERKLNAKILGEEAQTKLIFPLIMMLGIVLIIIMVPALTGM